MGKILCGVFVGVFVGALALKLLDKSRPGWLQQARKKLKNNVKAVKDAFTEGYSTLST